MNKVLIKPIQVKELKDVFDQLNFEIETTNLNFQLK